MALEKVQQILDKSQELLKQLETAGDDLDELQKAQVIQALVQAKVTVLGELKKADMRSVSTQDKTIIEQQVTELEAKVQHQVESLDVAKVQTALSYLGEGVTELIQRKQEGATVVEE